MWAKLIMSIWKFRDIISRNYNSLEFSLLETASLSRIVTGKGIQFYVPVNVRRGRGGLIIGQGNKFGVVSSHHFGNGSITLQPRSPEAKIIIGDFNWFNNNTVVVANKLISIGNGCQIGNQVAIYDCDFHEIDPNERWNSIGKVSPVIIGNNVWLGNRVIVLKGANIGDNSVIAAMSLVTRSIPANSLAAGVPARVIRSI